ncbi:phosphoribosylglycinamide formyltransferase [Patescibacteria group bacterium]|nr:phosphoribosylglycinamide formyltransferase [Patescibacteria group bacterium]MBU1016089.1 phosphoribosylglycinamide formyltransferase [Patescibacteria group bacterium]MBU1684832.1 phosphoribosylglycinamide formyltransferase [Patescibacteria group bacterium]MBU1938548.1 phosphoribosylglycinamide formyltransferase [Patescibacteria group bacterium]
MSYKIAILSSTNGTNLQSFIDARDRGELEGVEICCLITDKAMCGAADKARAAGIKVYFIDPKPVSRETYDQSIADTLAFFDVDLVVLGGYMKILGPAVVEKYRGRILNVHPSLLPKFAGGMNLSVHQAVLDAGETETGMTIHQVTEVVDGGEVILQKKVAVEPGDTAESLKDKVQALEKEWYPKVVKALAEGRDPKELMS